MVDGITRSARDDAYNEGFSGGGREVRLRRTSLVQPTYIKNVNASSRSARLSAGRRSERWKSTECFTMLNPMRSVGLLTAPINIRTECGTLMWRVYSAFQAVCALPMHRPIRRRIGLCIVGAPRRYDTSSIDMLANCSPTDGW